MPKPYQPFSNRSVSDWILQLQQANDPEDRLGTLQAIGVLATSSEKRHWADVSLEDSDPTIRALAAKLIGNMEHPLSEETDAKLVSLLGDADPDVRFESARALIRRKSRRCHETVPVLLAFLDEPETHALMVAAVINAVVEMDLNEETADAELRPRLLKWLDHERAEVREAGSIAFAKWPQMSSTCVERLLPLLDDSEPLVREKIAEAIGQTGFASEQIRVALVAASSDEDTDVARAANEALARLNK